MTVGTVIAAVRAQLVTQLQARAGMAGVVVSYAVPTVPEQVASDAVFFDASAEGTVSSLAIKALPARFKERWEQAIVIQRLPADDADDQAEAETRVAQLVGEVIDLLAADPSLGLALADWGRVTVLPQSWRWDAGLTDSGGYVVRCVLQLLIDADRS